MGKADLAKELWSLCTAISGFSILQSLAFAYGFKEASFRKQVRNARPFVCVATIFATALYCVAILMLTHMLIDISETAIVADISTVSWMEIAIVAISGVCVLGLGLVAK